jgi:hypothetical protein
MSAGSTATRPTPTPAGLGWPDESPTASRGLGWPPDPSPATPGELPGEETP